MRRNDDVIVVDPNLGSLKIWRIGKDGAVLWQTVRRDTSVVQDAAAMRRLIEKSGRRENVGAVSFRLLRGEWGRARVRKVDGAFLKECAGMDEAHAEYGVLILSLLGLCAGLYPDVPQYAFSETAFFSHLPEEEKYYAIPEGLGGRELRLQRTGFHGILHAHAAKISGGRGRVVSVVMDRMTTVCGIQGGRPVTISTGCTPLEGVMGAASCGDMDPGVVFHLMREMGLSIFQVDDILKKKSGFAGVTGLAKPPEEIFRLYQKRAQVTLAFDMYRNHILRHIGEAMAELAGADALVFSGSSLGALSPLVRTLRHGFPSWASTSRSCRGAWTRGRRR